MVTSVESALMPVPAELLRESWPVLAAYAAGATPFGYLAGKLKGIDLRQHGSGNIGATNALRVLGKPVGITVLLLDMLKGLLPVLLAMKVSDHPAVHVATALAAILGHNYTFWLGFKGGKGIATTAGAILPIMPWALLVAVVTWVIALLTSRYVSVASIAAAVVIPLTLVVQSLLTAAWNPVVLGFALFASTLAIWKHRSNIARLRRGEENRFGKKPATATAPESSPDRP
jgi:glycerol-3-phosphate acyltransferase PlsY